MTNNEQIITRFSTRVRQLILQFKETKKENQELYAMVDKRDAEIKQLKAQLAQAQNDYNSLKMARMLEITDGDLEEAKKRVAKLIREVNKCITLLSEK
jgi:multidrug resistance efflux pump